MRQDPSPTSPAGGPGALSPGSQTGSSSDDPRSWATVGNAFSTRARRSSSANTPRRIDSSSTPTTSAIAAPIGMRRCQGLEHRVRFHRAAYQLARPRPPRHHPVKRRARVVGIVRHQRSVVHVVGAVLADVHDEWQAGDRRLRPPKARWRCSGPRARHWSRRRTHTRRPTPRITAKPLISGAQPCVSASAGACAGPPSGPCARDTT